MFEIQAMDIIWLKAVAFYFLATRWTEPGIFFAVGKFIMWAAAIFYMVTWGLMLFNFIPQG